MTGSRQSCRQIKRRQQAATIPALDSLEPRLLLAVLVQYDFTGEPGNQASTAAAYVDPHMTATSVTRGSGISADTKSGWTNCMTSSGWNTYSNLDLKDYYSFGTWTVQAGYSMTLDHLYYSSQSESWGPCKYEVRYSRDQFATYTKLTAGSYPNTAIADTTIWLTGLDNLTGSIEFRLYACDCQDTSSDLRILNNTTDTTGLVLDGTVSPVDVAPINIWLSNSSMPEKQPAGTTVGTFHTWDANVGDTFTYTFVDGAGSDDNNKFALDGNTLKTAATFHYKTKNSYTVRVRSTDQTGLFTEQTFTVGITSVSPPTDIALSNGSVAENQPVGTVIGTLSTTDPNIGDTFTYTFVGTSGTDNAAFTISGNELKTAASFNYEAKNSYSIRVRATDQTGLFTEKAFAVSVTNVNEGPTDIQLHGSVAENQPSGTTVGTLTTADPDAGDTFTYTFVGGAGSDDDGLFTIDGETLKTAATFDYEAKNSYTIRVQSTDQGGLSTEKAVAVNIIKGTLDFNANGLTQFWDADGTSVTVSLRGGGNGTLYFAHDGWCDASRIVLTGTAEMSTLTITTKGGGVDGTSVGGIDTQGSPIGTVVAATTDLTGNLSIGASLNPKASVALTFDQIKNASITTEMSVKSLTASEWLDDDGIPDVLTAPAAGTITITGKKANLRAGINAIQGDFQADLDLGSSNGSVLALTSLTVAGVIDSSTITARGHDLKGLSVGTIKAGRVDDSTVVADGGVNTISTSQWQSGSITAGWVGTVATNSNAALGGLGHFGAGLVLTGAALPAKKATLNSVNIAGDLLSCTWDVRAGYVGSLTFAGTVDHSLIRSAGDITSIKLGASNTSDFGAGVDFDVLQSSRHVAIGDAANAPTGTIKTLTVAGWRPPRGQSMPRLFIETSISARIGKLNLLNWDNQGGLYAPAGSVKSVVYKDTTDKTKNWVWPGSAGGDDFVHVI